MNNIELRPYQQRMVAETYARIREGYRRILLVAVMSSGKTIISGWMIRDAARRGKRCLFLVDLNSLLDQTADEFRSLGIPCTILQGSRLVDSTAPVVVASRDTIGSRLERGQSLDALLGPLNLIVADECHDTAYSSVYEALADHYADAFFLGLTATPWRRSKRNGLAKSTMLQ